jgi:hypothetical protein
MEDGICDDEESRQKVRVCLALREFINNQLQVSPRRTKILKRIFNAEAYTGDLGA